MMVRKQAAVPSHEEQHKSGGWMNAQPEYMKNHTKCEDQWKLTTSVLDNVMGKIDFVY